MSAGRVLGLDPGERRIGVALSDALGIIAQPHAVLDQRTDDVIGRLRALVTEYDVSRVVVGLPVSLAGGEGASAQMARTLGEAMGNELGVDIVYYDERFTSVRAEAALLEADVSRADRRQKRDKVAAAIMLQGFLDSESAGNEGRDHQ
jgi:putative Holliday junction resolvase